MSQPRYILKPGTDLTVFEFVSIGPRGKILKVVVFSKTEIQDLYYLGFGDKNDTTGFIDDSVVTNNNDTQKVLATIASAIMIFTNKQPEAMIYATGSTPSRTRLYRMGINRYYEQLIAKFHIFGVDGGDELAHYEKDRSFKGYLIQSKSK